MPWLIDHELAPPAIPIAFAVMVSQFAIAFAFWTTRMLRPALWTAVTLNCVFVAMGAVSPSVFYLVIELTLLAALDNGVFGEDQRKSPKPWSIGAKLGAASACLPYFETLQPAEVIDDPAIILATVATIAAATEALAVIGNVDFGRPRGTLTRFHFPPRVIHRGPRTGSGIVDEPHRARSWPGAQR